MHRKAVLHAAIDSAHESGGALVDQAPDAEHDGSCSCCDESSAESKQRLTAGAGVAGAEEDDGSARKLELLLNLTRLNDTVVELRGVRMMTLALRVLSDSPHGQEYVGVLNVGGEVKPVSVASSIKEVSSCCLPSAQRADGEVVACQTSLGLLGLCSRMNQFSVLHVARAVVEGGREWITYH